MTNQIPASYTVDVNITIQDLFATSGDFSAFNFVGVSSVISANERIRQYTSSTAVGVDFGTNSEEFTAADTFFSQNPNPGFMYISRWFNVAAPGQYITNLTTTALSSLITINNGQFNISIDGSAHDIDSINLTSVTSWSQVAAAFQTAIRAIGTGGFTAATVTAINGALGTYFVFSSGITGSSSTVDYIHAVSGGSGTDLTSLLNLLGGTSVTGVNAESPVQALQAISAINDDYYGVAFTSVLRDTSNTITVAQYIESLTKVFFACSNDANCLSSISTSDVLYELEQLGLNRTILTYHNNAQYYPDVSIASNMLSVDYSGNNTVKDADFKPVPGIPSVPLTLAQLNILVGKNGNTVISQAGLTYYTPGNMVSGRAFDITQNVDWLQSYIQTNLITFIVNASPKIPYTDGGAGSLEQNVRQSLQQAVVNGMLASTNTDANGNTLQPYTTSVPRVATIPLNQRASRVGPPITFTAQLSGSIRHVTVNGTVTV